MTRAMDIGYFPNRNLRCPGCDERLSGDSVEYVRIARDMAEMVGEIDPYGIADAVEAAGYEATGYYSEDVATLAQVYLDTLNDPRYGVPYAIAILREEYLPYIGENEGINRMAVSILSRLEALDKGPLPVRSGARPRSSAKSGGKASASRSTKAKTTKTKTRGVRR